MGDSSVIRDFAWTESSGSDDGVDPFADESDFSSQSSDDLEAPFARHGPLLEADPDSLRLNFVSIWVQLHGLPLEYHDPELAERMGQMIGAFEKIDWEERLPRNIRFMRIKVRLNPWLPIVSGFMLHLDDGTRTWIQCRYWGGGAHKLCTKCGLIGHARSQCNESMDEVEHMLIR